MSLAAVMVTVAGEAFAQEKQEDDFRCGPGHVRAFDLKGNKLWDFQPKGLTHCIKLGEDDTVYVLSSCYRGHRGIGLDATHVESRLYALDSKTGKLRWEFLKEGHLLTLPILAGQNIVFEPYKFRYTGAAQVTPDPGIFCLDTKTGRVKWKYPLPHFLAGVPPLAVADNMVFETYAEKPNPYVSKILVLDLESGKRLNVISLGELLGTDVAFVGAWSPGKEIIISVFRGGTSSAFELMALDNLSGKILWQVHERRAYIPVADDGKVLRLDGKVFFQDSGLRCFGVISGHMIWKLEGNWSVDPKPIKVDGKWMLWTPAKGGPETKFSLIDTETGKMVDPKDYRPRQGHAIPPAKDLVYSSGSRKRDEGWKLTCFDRWAGKVVWETATDANDPLYAEGKVYHIARGQLECSDALTGRPEWSAEARAGRGVKEWEYGRLQVGGVGKGIIAVFGFSDVPTLPGPDYQNP